VNLVNVAPTNLVNVAPTEDDQAAEAAGRVFGK